MQGREAYDIEHYMRIQLRAFHALGVDLTSTESTKGNLWRTALTWSALFSMTTCMGIYSLQYMGQLDVTSEAFAPFLQCALGVWKLSMVLYKHKDIVQLVQQMCLLPMEASENALKLISAENTREKLLSFLYFNNCNATAIVPFLMPICIMSYLYLKDGFVTYVVPLKGTYPFDYNSPLNYVLIFMWCLTGTFCVYNATVGVDSLYNWFVHCIVAQFRILHMKLGEPELKLETSFEECIRSHQRVIGFAVQLNAVYRPILFAEFAINAIQICFIAFQLGRGVSLGNMPFLVVFLAMVLVQLMMYCYCGQSIETESENTSTVFYDAVDWQQWLKKGRAVCVIFMARAQKSCKLSGIFFEINLRLFLWVVQSAASYVTLLWSLG